MPLIDLSNGKPLRVADQPVSRVRVANQEIYRGPFSTDFEDGSRLFAAFKSGPSSNLYNETGLPTRSGVRSVGFGRDTPSHMVAVDNSQAWAQWDVVEVWLRLSANTEVNPLQARLAGLCVADADSSAFWCAALDSRNGSGSTAGIQIREAVSLTGVVGNPVVPAVKLEQWYRLKAWVEPTRVAVHVFDESGAQIGGVGRPIENLPSRLYFGLYSYGQTIFDDYSVTPV